MPGALIPGLARHPGHLVLDTCQVPGESLTSLKSSRKCPERLLLFLTERGEKLWLSPGYGIPYPFVLAHSPDRLG